MQRVQLGNTGIETSYLAIGTGTNGWNGSSNQTRLGFEECVNLLEYAYDNGVAFIDSADMYGSHHETAALAKRVGRGNLVIATKTGRQRRRKGAGGHSALSQGALEPTISTSSSCIA